MRGECSRGLVRVRGGAGGRAGTGAELPALACACRVQGPQRTRVEGEGFLQKSPGKEPHFTDVSGAAEALGLHWGPGGRNEGS